MIRTLVFDLGGVVMNHNIPLTIEKFERLMGTNIAVLGLAPNGEARDMNEQEKKRLSTAISNAASTSSVMHDFELGLVGIDEFVAALLPLCQPGTTREDILDAWDTMHAGIPSSRFDMLREWHKEYPLYALSNNNEAHWEDIHLHYPDFDSYFDGLFASHLVHIGKPDPRIFEYANQVIEKEWNATHQQPYRMEETIFVDDLEANRKAARDYGWQACASMDELAELLRLQ